MRRVLLASVAALSAITFGVLGGGSSAFAQEDKNIVEIAAATPNLSTLVTAVTAAELAETLSGPGPFTVFAPTDDAFKALPAGTLDTLLKDPKGDLANILKLHVLSGAVDSKAAIAAAGGTVDSLGGKITVALDGDTLLVGGAKVSTADIKASNGVIHIIDAVITAPAEAMAAAGDAAPDATEATADAAAEVPTEVNTGTDGLAASSNSNGMLIALAGLGALGIVGSSLVIARRRR
jgi:uncharacterized surface protein with fasciclin (FAS1) repeats